MTSSRPHDIPPPDPPTAKSVPKATVVALVAALLLVGLAIIWVLRGGLATPDLMLKRRSRAHPVKTLRAVEARSRRLLDRYALVDEKTGRYRIPIARAMERLLQHKTLLKGAPPPPTPAASRPQASPPTASTPQASPIQWR